MKLTPEQIIEIYNSSKTLRELATEFKVSHVNIYKIRAGKIHREITAPKLVSQTYLVKCGDDWGYITDGKVHMEPRLPLLNVCK
jgi:hypothetical protein